MEAHGLTRSKSPARIAIQRRSANVLRRCLDLVFALALILFLSPILIGVALAVRFSYLGAGGKV